MPCSGIPSGGALRIHIGIQSIVFVVLLLHVLNACVVAATVTTIIVSINWNVQ